MKLISLKDYAKMKNITYEAVRKSVVRYREELEGHIIVEGKTQYLDEYAVAFLDEKRQKNPVVIIQESKDERIAALEAENAELLRKYAAVAEWKAENAEKIAQADNTLLLLDSTKASLEAETAARIASDEKANQAYQETMEAVDRSIKAEEAMEAANRRTADLEAAWAEFDKLPFWKKPFFKRPQ